MVSEKSNLAAFMYRQKIKGTRPGTGERFKAMVEILRRKGARDPKALAAWIGRKKYGQKQMTKWAVAGRK